MEDEKNSLIQQRIKRMIENKRKTKDDQEQHLKRIKSGVNEFDTEQEPNKPQSTIRLRRPVSAFKASESSQPLIPTKEKPDIDIRAILVTVFEHGKKLQQFLLEQKLSSSKYLEWLSSNELFTLGVCSKLKDVPQQKYSTLVELEAIAKIGRHLQVSNQTRKCQEVENKISQILEDRLRKLSKYSV